MTIKEIRKYCNEFTEHMKADTEQSVLESYAEMRGLPVEAFDGTDLFFIYSTDSHNNVVDYFYDGFNLRQLGVERLICRMVFPVKDINGDVMGFHGYDNLLKPKYLDSQTPGYVAKLSTCYGMEMIPKYLNDYITELKPIIVTEGIVDCICLRYLGFNSLALLGSTINPTMTLLMKYTNAIYIADNDLAGMRLVKNIHRYIPNCDTFSYCVNGTKDTNDAYKIYGKELLTDLISKCVKNIDPGMVITRC